MESVFRVLLTRGDSGIDNIAYLSGDDTRLGTDHTKADVYESSDNMLVSHSISENQSESDMDLKDYILSDDESNQTLMMESIF